MAGRPLRPPQYVLVAQVDQGYDDRVLLGPVAVVEDPILMHTTCHRRVRVRARARVKSRREADKSSRAAQYSAGIISLKRRFRRPVHKHSSMHDSLRNWDQEANMPRLWQRFRVHSPVTQYRGTCCSSMLFDMGGELSIASAHTAADSLSPGTYSKEPAPRLYFFRKILLKSKHAVTMDSDESNDPQRQRVASIELLIYNTKHSTKQADSAHRVG